MTGPEAQAAAADKRWREKADTAGYRDRTEDEWVAHPTALDDLARVICGVSTSAIDHERRRERKARAA